MESAAPDWRALTASSRLSAGTNSMSGKDLAAC